MFRKNPVGVDILGLGSCLPETRVTNMNLVDLMDTSDEWIGRRTGVRERRFATPRESLPILMAIAGQRALDDAGLDIGDIDYMVAVDNATDPMSTPVTSARTQFLMGLSDFGIPTFNVSAGCSGVSYATEAATALARQNWHYYGMQRTNILLIGGDIMSNVTPMETEFRSSAVLLSDAAAAMVLGIGWDPTFGIQRTINHADGSLGKHIHYGPRPYNQMVITNPPAFGLPREQWGGGIHPFRMYGRAVHKFIGNKCVNLVKDLLVGSGFALSDLEETTIIPHQMNLRSIEMAMGRLREEAGCEPRLVYTNGIQMYGNNSVASIPLGLDELHRSGKLETSDLVMGIAFGAGLTWGGFLTAWNKGPPTGPATYDIDEQRLQVDRLNERYEEWKVDRAK